VSRKLNWSVWDLGYPGRIIHVTMKLWNYHSSSQPPQHCNPATWYFHSSIFIEALLWGCHLDMKGLLHKQHLTFAVAQHQIFIPLNWVVVFTCAQQQLTSPSSPSHRHPKLLSGNNYSAKYTTIILHFGMNTYLKVDRSLRRYEASPWCICPQPVYRQGEILPNRIGHEMERYSMLIVSVNYIYHFLQIHQLKTYTCRLWMLRASNMMTEFTDPQ